MPIRAGAFGFNLRILGDVDVASGAFEFLGDFRRAIRIDPSGLFTVGLLATSDYLGWATQAWTAPGTGQTFLNSIALVESITEFYRFLELELVPHGSHSTTWSSRILCRRFNLGPICLREGRPTMTLPMLNPNAASAAGWSATVPVTNAPQIDAFAALRELYALFALPEGAIPFTEDGAVSLEQLRAVS